MALFGHASYLSLKRIIDNVEECKSERTHEASPEEETTVASRDDEAQPILSEPVKANKNRRKKPWSQEAIQAALLGAVLFVGIVAFIGLLIVQ